MLTPERIMEIFKETTSSIGSYQGLDRTILGLNLIHKYTGKGIGAAEHDIIYSEASLDDLAASPISDEEIAELARMNWHIEDDGLAKFV